VVCSLHFVPIVGVPGAGRRSNVVEATTSASMVARPTSGSILSPLVVELGGQASLTFQFRAFASKQKIEFELLPLLHKRQPRLAKWFTEATITSTSDQRSQ
jgi:hypothetical protein